MRRVRIPFAMLRRLSAGIFIIVLIILAAVPALADTGTYGIAEYNVTLEPREDGQVKISIEQEWNVYSGSIPWVTVGLPNRHFEIESSGGAGDRIRKENSGGFTGVRIDLDKDYQPGESFSVSFSVLQSNLLERLPDEEIWRIKYTPGWYDRASIEKMQIRLISPVHIDSYETLKPTPADISGNTITWERSNIAPGGKFEITVESVDGRFLKEGAGIITGDGGHDGTATGIYALVGILVVIGLLVGVLIWDKRRKARARTHNEIMRIEAEMAKDEKKKEEIEQGFKKYVEEENLHPDEEGRYRDKKHGYVTPALWAAVISNQYRTYHPYTGPHMHSGTGYRPSCVSCACVSCACACACACAGGGAAGCSRKTLHECPACREREKKTENIAYRPTQTAR
jgi:hypothetical protein